MLDDKTRWPSLGPHPQTPDTQSALFKGRGCLLMTRYQGARVDHPLCGNHADGQLCTMPLLHDGRHASRRLRIGEEQRSLPAP